MMILMNEREEIRQADVFSVMHYLPFFLSIKHLPVKMRVLECKERYRTQDFQLLIYSVSTTLELERNTVMSHPSWSHSNAAAFSLR